MNLEAKFDVGHDVEQGYRAAGDQPGIADPPDQPLGSASGDAHKSIFTNNLVIYECCKHAGALKLKKRLIGLGRAGHATYRRWVRNDRCRQPEQTNRRRHGERRATRLDRHRNAN